MRYIFPCLSLTWLLACDTEQPTEDNDGAESTEGELVEPTYGEEAFVLDFGEGGEDSWFAVNDTVMGGVSNGEVTFGDGTMVFEGAVSTDNDGGFASVRSPEELYDFSEYSRVLIRLKSEGQPFSIILANNRWWFEDQFKFDIDLPDEDWHTIEVPFSDFQLYTLQGGYPTATGIEMRPEDTTEIFHIELMSKLFEDGPFRLEVDYIAFD